MHLAATVDRPVIRVGVDDLAFVAIAIAIALVEADGVLFTGTDRHVTVTVDVPPARRGPH